MNVQTILAIVQAADAIAGSEVGKKLLGFLSRDAGLTEEQRGNLEENYADYLTRIERLRRELGQ